MKCMILLSTLLLGFTNCSEEKAKPLLLFDAMKEGNRDVAKWLLNHGADINERDISGRTPLMRLMETNDSMDMVKFLVEEHADVNAADDEGKTALHHAAANGHLDQFKYLLKNGANYSVKDRQERNVMHLAADNGQCSILESMKDELTDTLNATDQWGRNPMWYAAHSGSHKCYSVLKGFGSATDSDTLIAGVNGGDLEVVRSLLVSHQDVDTKNASGMTLLQIACDSKHTPVAKLLIDQGADINIRDGDRRNLLHTCSSSGSGEIVSLLLSRGFDVNTEDAFGNTPAHYAAISDEPEVLSTLIQHNGNIRARNNENYSPAEVAVENNSLKALSLLLNSGYDKDEFNPNMKTLCHVAVERGAVEALNRLIQLKADCNKNGESGNYPIHYAINNVDMLKTLIQAGVNVDAPGAEGKTALEMSVDTVNRQAAACLLKYGARPENVRVTSSPDDRYFAYVKNPAITTRKDVYELINKVKNGDLNAAELDC